jgi:hypothetical protein
MVGVVGSFVSFVMLICLLAFCVSLLISRNRSDIGSVIYGKRSGACDDHTKRLELVANYRGSRIDSEELAQLSACEELSHTQIMRLSSVGVNTSNGGQRKHRCGQE